jgi:hypothetical protein
MGWEADTFTTTQGHSPPHQEIIVVNGFYETYFVCVQNWIKTSYLTLTVKAACLQINQNISRNQFGEKSPRILRKVKRFKIKEIIVMLCAIYDTFSCIFICPKGHIMLYLLASVRPLAIWFPEHNLNSIWPTMFKLHRMIVHIG